MSASIKTNVYRLLLETCWVTKLVAIESPPITMTSLARKHLFTTERHHYPKAHNQNVVIEPSLNGCIYKKKKLKPKAQRTLQKRRQNNYKKQRFRKFA